MGTNGARDEGETDSKDRLPKQTPLQSSVRIQKGIWNPKKCNLESEESERVLLLEEAFLYYYRHGR